ncbi:MAG: UbiA family prenyltransferase [Deltaproteobacteria bacterium]|nr:UbiA family prenyltransferase [Deltaproteobacteria bacterium]
MEIPLCVDLDGTLIKGDSLAEGMVYLVKRSPFFVFRFIFWLFKGKAFLKARVSGSLVGANRVFFYNKDVLEWLHLQKLHGQQLFLVTGADQTIASAVAQETGLFDEVMASNGIRNLTGKTKAESLVERFGRKNYDYLGDSSKDIAPCLSARNTYLVTPSPALLKQFRRRGIDAQTPWGNSPGSLTSLLKASRPHQWSKNLLIFVAPLLAHRFEPTLWLQTLLAFLAFCLCSSGVYLLNDIIDLDADRKHTNKSRRPLAAGQLSLSLALIISTLFMTAGLAITLAVHPVLLIVMALYLTLTMAYSFRLKRSPIIDILVLAGLYTIRIVTGGIAAGVEISHWLLIFSIFFFLSLAFLKRHVEVSNMAENHKVPGRGYYGEDKLFLLVGGLNSGFLAVLVFLFYLTDRKALTLYHQPSLLILICPVLIYWTGRLWLLAHRGQMHDDPIFFALRDWHSYLVGLAIGAIMFAAS